MRTGVPRLRDRDQHVQSRAQMLTHYLRTGKTSGFSLSFSLGLKSTFGIIDIAESILSLLGFSGGTILQRNHTGLSYVLQLRLADYCTDHDGLSALDKP